MAPRVPYLLSRNSSSRYGTRYGTRGSRYGTRGARGARGASSVSLITVPAGLSRASRPASHGPGAHRSRHVAHRFLIVSARSVCVCVCVCARVSSLTSFSLGHHISCVHALACGLVCVNIIIIITFRRAACVSVCVCARVCLRSHHFPRVIKFPVCMRSRVGLCVKTSSSSTTVAAAAKTRATTTTTTTTANKHRC